MIVYSLVNDCAFRLFVTAVISDLIQPWSFETGLEYSAGECQIVSEQHIS